MALSCKSRLIGQALAGVLAVMPIAAPATVEAIDDSGRRIRLAQPAQRIVALAPHLTELLFEAGAGPAIVGAAEFSDYPPAARSIPRVGDARALDLERIVALQPDLIVAWASGTPSRQVQRLRALGHALFLQEPADLDAIGAAIERLGVLSGTAALARQRADAFGRGLARIRAAHERGAPVRVFYQVAEWPLITVSSRHVIADALRTCGADNVFAAARDWLPRPTREAVLLADPDAIVVAASPADSDPLLPWRRWVHLRAVRSGHLYTVDPSLLHRATPRILQGIEVLCGHIAHAARRS
jgi:iron complex transport system substrate-binding protein